MNIYGDTPLGMVEAAMEFIRICESNNFNQIVHKDIPHVNQLVHKDIPSYCKMYFWTAYNIWTFLTSGSSLSRLIPLSKMNVSCCVDFVENGG